MLSVVAILCAVALDCHLIVAANPDITDDEHQLNATFVVQLTTLQSEIEPRAENEGENKKKQNFCSRPPDIDGVLPPILELQEYPLGAIISYQCKFGYVSRSSGSLLSICRLDSQSRKAEWSYPNTTCIPRSCGDPGFVLNGRRIGNLFTFPNSVKFECLEGYKLQGLKDRYCQASGEWSGNLPTCAPIRCPVPTNPENGRVFYSSLDYGTELEYQCNKGFMLRIQQPRICNEDGIWSNEKPQCAEISCEMPKPPEHGTVRLYDDPPKAGTLAFYSCDDGATLIGASTSKCLNSGYWTFEPPKCLRSCYAHDFEHGELGRYRTKGKSRYRQEYIALQVGESVKHHETVIVRCKDGYSPKNGTTDRTKEVECNDGAWSDPLQCYPMPCSGQPPPTKNGYPMIENRMHGNVIWYKCDDGYHKPVKGRVVCEYGKWKGTPPACIDYRCFIKELKYPGLLKPQRDFIKHREQFDLKCDKSYNKISKKEQVICSEGRWDITENPCTIKTCDDEPPIVNNGKPLEFARINGSFVDYECEDGYELEGYSTVHCAFGAWIGKPPACKLLMENITMEKEVEKNPAATNSPNRAQHSALPEDCFCTYDYRKDYLGAYWKNREIDSHHKIKKGERVIFICRYPSMDIVWPNGLRFYKSMELVCDRCQDWKEHDLPQCERRASGDSFIANDNFLTILPGGIIEVVHSEKISLTCINPWMQPMWNTTHRKGITFQSNPVPVAQTGFHREDIIIEEMDYENAGKYECNAMYYGQKLRPAIIDLKIAGVEVLCRDLSTETNRGSFEIRYSNGKKVNSKAYYTCKDSMQKIVGSSERVCLENGKWSHSVPACADISCPLLNENNDFIITYSNFGKVNSQAYYTCRSINQELIGSSNRTCLHSGKWSGTNPICMDITCPVIRTYNGLSVSYSSGRKVNSIASFSCLNHATLIGNPTAICLYNGTWSQPKPSCEMMEIHCPKIEGKGIFTIKYNNNRRVNSTALFFCKEPNKKVAGCNFMTCQQNGEWSGDYPTCVDYVSCDLFIPSPNLNVLYTDFGRIGSVASFQCLPPHTLVGNSSATCLSNGTWSHSLPSCAAPNCSIETLQMTLPESLYPDLENVTSESVTPGSEFLLICEEDLVLTGSLKAICNFNGKWEFSDAQCISACRVNKGEASHLIVEPEKDYYRFGEFILLSCPPGQKLTSEVERMMCLGRTWSDTLPDCIELTDPDLFGFTQATMKLE